MATTRPAKPQFSKTSPPPKTLNSLCYMKPSLHPFFPAATKVQIKNSQSVNGNQILSQGPPPLLFFRNPFLAATPPKTAAANTPIIQSFQSAQSSTQKPLFEPSALSRFLHEEPSKVEGFGFVGVRNGPLLPGDSSFGIRVRAGPGGSRGDTGGEDEDETDDYEKTDWLSDDDDDDDDDDGEESD